MNGRTTCTPQDIQAFDTTGKIALLATVNPQGLPHVTLITTLQAKSDRQMMWGQFSQGVSKLHVRDNPNTAFLILSLDRRFWRGRTRFTHAVHSGEDYDLFNQKPMFRYNSYFGINTVYYMDLLEISGPDPLPMSRIITASVLTALAKGVWSRPGAPDVLNHWTRALVNSMGSLTFLAAVDAEGFPRIIPAIQTQVVGHHRLAFSLAAFGSELSTLRTGETLAVYTINPRLESVLMRGVYAGVTRRLGVEVGCVEVDWVYNSMPPKQGQIYPPPPMEAITRFD